MKDQIREILLNLIYTPDAKPRFHNGNWVGGDVDTKLQRINTAVDALHGLLPKPEQPRDIYQNAAEYLSGYDTHEELVKMVDNILYHESKGLGTDLIDYVDGVCVWEKIEGEFTCTEFINLIMPIEECKKSN